MCVRSEVHDFILSRPDRGCWSFKLSLTVVVRLRTTLFTLSLSSPVLADCCCSETNVSFFLLCLYGTPPNKIGKGRRRGRSKILPFRVVRV